MVHSMPPNEYILSKASSRKKIFKCINIFCHGFVVYLFIGNIIGRTKSTFLSDQLLYKHMKQITSKKLNVVHNWVTVINDSWYLHWFDIVFPLLVCQVNCSNIDVDRIQMWYFLWRNGKNQFFVSQAPYF